MKSFNKMIRLLRPKRGSMSIWDQLLLEEAVYRNGQENVCILNEGSMEPTIVVGFSGKVEKLVDSEVRQEFGLKMVRRFSGGGTVVVDESTAFVSFLFDKEMLDGRPVFPRDIMQWSGEIYDNVFQSLGVNGFQLQADDYTIGGNLKIGGNAQAISGNRFVHHTSFLWDYNDDLMQALKNPEKQPEYREKRNHSDFLLRIKDVVALETTVDDFFDAIEQEFRKNNTVQYWDIEEALEWLENNPPSRVSNRIL